ncbi:MAG TPA: copper resistance protein B [Allosphingosinicella sp.]|jgi:copper resistance protein B
MKRLILLLALGTSAPALAQHGGHGAHQPAPPAEAPDPHAGHVMPEPAPAPAPPVDPHAGHHMPEAAPADPHAGHHMPEAAPADPHAGHNMADTRPPVAPPSAAALSGPAHAADAVYGTDAMTAARGVLREEHGRIRTAKVLIDRLEYRSQNGRDGFAWDAEGWYGGDIDKLWLKSEGEGVFGERLEHGEAQSLWSHAIDPWFDLQLGLRQDFGRGPDRTYLALGVQGLAPYWVEVDAAAFVSTKGDVTARVEAEYDLRITQKLILQPEAELQFSLQDVPELRVGSGLSAAEAGLRLRYQVKPEFAPYLGVEYQRGFGDTARLRRADGDDAGGWSLLLGVRAWF